MKAYWMNNEAKNEEKTERTEKKSFNEIVANDCQKRAMAKLMEQVFGSVEGYKKFRDSGAQFPQFYRNFKNFILLCGDENFNDEWFDELVRLCPKAQLISEETNEADEKKSGDGTKSDAIQIDQKIAKYIRMDGRKGTRARSTARDPQLISTYKARVSVLQSRLRASNYNEAEVARVAELYTTRYNEHFGTAFEVHHSTKKEKNTLVEA